MSPLPLHMTVNGEAHRLLVETNRVLLDVLRNDLELTGTKKGCGLGKCGACTVLLNGRPVHACLTLAHQAEGCEITTIEGVGEKGLHPIQDAFIKNGAIQCGFCTPGMINTAKALLDENATPTRADIKQAIAGNLCRCTGYNNIVDAIHACGCQSDKEKGDIK